MGDKHLRAKENTSKKIPKEIKHDLEDDESFESWYYTNLQTQKFRKDEKAIPREDIIKEYNRKFFGFMNRKPVDNTFTSEKKIENAEFLLEYGDANLDKKMKVARLNANDIIKQLKKNSEGYDLSSDITNFLNDK